jgi:hypothetical protein
MKRRSFLTGAATAALQPAVVDVIETRLRWTFHTTVASGSSFVRTPFPNNTIPSSQFNSIGKSLVGFYPSPNLPGIGNNYELSALQNTGLNTATFRGDVQVTSKLLLQSRQYHGAVRASAAGGSYSGGTPPRVERRINPSLLQTGTVVSSVIFTPLASQCRRWRRLLLRWRPSHGRRNPARFPPGNDLE